MANLLISRTASERAGGAGRVKGFTLLELILVSVIILTFALMLMPALSAARVQSLPPNCVSNLRQLGMALHMYAADWDGFVPRHTDDVSERPTYDQFLLPYAGGNESLFHCPSDNVIRGADRPARSYSTLARGFAGTNPNRIPPLRIHEWLPGCMYLIDKHAPWNMMGSHDSNYVTYACGGVFSYTHYPDRYSAHSTGDNFLFIDGSARWLEYDPADEVRWRHTP